MSTTNIDKEIAKIEHQINTMQADLYELIFDENEIIQQKIFADFCIEYSIAINACKKKKMGFAGMLLSLAMANVIKEGVYRGLIKNMDSNTFD